MRKTWLLKDLRLVRSSGFEMDLLNTVQLCRSRLLAHKTAAALANVALLRAPLPSAALRLPSRQTPGWARWLLLPPAPPLLPGGV